jgi:hypothetical protein
MPDDTILYLADVTTIPLAPERYLNIEVDPIRYEPFAHAVDPQWQAALTPWEPLPPVAAVLEQLRQALHAPELTTWHHPQGTCYGRTAAAIYLLQPHWADERQRWELRPALVEELPCL